MDICSCIEISGANEVKTCNSEYACLRPTNVGSSNDIYPGLHFREQEVLKRTPYYFLPELSSIETARLKHYVIPIVVNKRLARHKDTDHGKA